MFNTPLITLPGPWRIPIQLDMSLVFLVLLIFSLNGGAPSAQTGVFLVVVIFSILLHELGHAWGCVVQGVPVTRIVLHGGGGFCQHTVTRDPKQDEFIIICGPLVNIALWALATLALDQIGAPQPSAVQVGGEWIVAPSVPSPLHMVLETVAQVNLFLGLFNLLPVLPLDGGGLLNAWLHRFMRGISANRVSGAVGMAMVVLWIPMMLAGLYYFGFILLFVPPIGLHWRMMRTGMG